MNIDYRFPKRFCEAHTFELIAFRTHQHASRTIRLRWPAGVVGGVDELAIVREIVGGELVVRLASDLDLVNLSRYVSALLAADAAYYAAGGRVTA